MMRFNLKNKDNINAPNTSSSLILLVAAPVMCAAAGGMGWGGLLCALIVLVGYVGYIKKDRLARNMAFVGIMSGGLGFTMGQWIQSKNSWSPIGSQPSICLYINGCRVFSLRNFLV